MKNKITSLLIDEKADQRIQFYLSLDLLHVNRACVCHDNGFDALAYLKQKPEFTPDYIFISSDLSKTHAALFIRHIRKMKRLELVPVILLAATAACYTPVEISDTGFAGCLLKQGDIYFLRDALKSVFEKEYQAVDGTAPNDMVNNIAAAIWEEINSTRALLEAPRRLSA